MFLQVKWHAKFGSSVRESANRFKYAVAKGVVSFEEDGVSILVRYMDRAGLYSIEILGKSVSPKRTEPDALGKVANQVEDVFRVCARRLPGITLVEEALRPSPQSKHALTELQSEQIGVVKAHVLAEPDYIVWSGAPDVTAAELLTRSERELRAKNPGAVQHNISDGENNLCPQRPWSL